MSSEGIQIPSPQLPKDIGYQVPTPNGYDEIAHVLFLDLVGFTKLKPAKQTAVLGKLQEIVRETTAFDTARKENQLIALPTGDGMALVFLNPVGGSGPAISCAEEIAAAVIKYNDATREEKEKINIRMGLHSGNIVKLSDINDRLNVAGEGINTAQRVMDCGDIGHILLSNFTVNVLPATPDRSEWCHSLGQVRVKHDQKVSLYSFFNNEIGNQETPNKIHLQIQEEQNLKDIRARLQEADSRRRVTQWVLAGVLTLIALVAIAAGVAWSFTRTPGPPSLAVLPFTPGTQKNSSRAISKGLTEQFMSRFRYMTNVQLQPISTVRNAFTLNSAGQTVPPSPLEASKKLNVRYVLTGTAESYSNDPNLNSTDSNADFSVDLKLELYDRQADAVVWKQEYQSTPFSQLIPLQHQLIKEMAKKMEATMVEGEEAKTIARDTQNPSGAHLRYMTGRFWSTERPNVENLKADEIAKIAIQNYEEAIKLDPTYARAHAGLTDMYTSISGVSMDPREAREKAIEAAKNAQNCGDKHAEVYASISTEKWWLERDYAVVYASIGTEKWWLERDFSTAKIAFLLSIELDDQFSDSHKRYSSCLAALGDHTAARKHIGRALSLEPESIIIQLTSAQNYFFAREYGPAIDQLRTIISKNPKMSVAYRFLAMALEQKDMNNQALEELEKGEGENKGDSDFLGARGHILARMGKNDEALKIALNLEALKKENGPYVSPYNIAVIYAEIADREKDALCWLDKAIIEFDPRVNWLKVDPRFNKLRKSKEADFNQRLEFKVPDNSCESVRS